LQEAEVGGPILTLPWVTRSEPSSIGCSESHDVERALRHLRWGLTRALGPQARMRTQDERRPVEGELVHVTGKLRTIDRLGHFYFYFYF
jgi:hypothetical protein